MYFPEPKSLNFALSQCMPAKMIIYMENMEIELNDDDDDETPFETE